MLDPVGDLRPVTEGVVDIERVGPGLHEARGRHRRRRHRRSEPRHLLAIRDSSRSATPSAVRPASHRASRSAGASWASSMGALVDEAGRVGDRLQHHRRPTPPCPRRVSAWAASTATSSVHSRWAIVVAIVQPSAGTGVTQPASSRPATAARSWSPSALRSAIDLVEHAHVLLAVVGCRCERSEPRNQVSLERCRPLVEDPTPTSGVVAEGAGQAEAAHQVQGGLDQLAYAGLRLVGAQQLDRHRVGLATDEPLERRDRLEQGLVGAGGHPELERRGEHRPGEVVAEHLDDRAGALLAARQLGRPGGQLLAAPLGQVGHRGDDEVVLGREVVQLGASADAGALRDQRGRRTAEAVLDQQLDGCLEQPRPHGAGALLLRHACGRSTADMGSGWRGTNKQSSLTVTLFPSRTPARAREVPRPRAR